MVFMSPMGRSVVPPAEITSGLVNALIDVTEIGILTIGHSVDTYMSECHNATPQHSHKVYERVDC